MRIDMRPKQQATNSLPPSKIKARAKNINRKEIRKGTYTNAANC